MMTYEELLAQGAVPIDEKTQAPIAVQNTAQSKLPTMEELMAQGAVPHEEESTASKVIDAALLPLHYSGDVVRAGIGELTGTLKEGEGMKALKGGGAPSSAELMKRGGWENTSSLSDVVPGAYSDTGDEWLKLKKGGMLDPTARGTVGLAADVATDPLTYLTAGLGKMASAEGASTATKALNAYLNPVGAVTDAVGSGLSKAGKGIYKSAFKEADDIAQQYGKEVLPSDVLMDSGAWGKAHTIFGKAKDKIASLMDERNALVSAADNAGVEANMQNAMKPALDHIAELRASRVPKNLKVADALEEQVNEYLQHMGSSASPTAVASTGGILSDAAAQSQKGAKLSQVLEAKTSEYGALPDNAYKLLTKTSKGKEGLKKLAFGLKEESENMAGQAVPGGDKALANINEQLGALLTGSKTMNKNALKELRKNPITEIDMLSLAAGPKYAIAKAGGKALKSTAVRTGAGLGLNRVGNQLVDKMGNPIIRSTWGSILKHELENNSEKK